jgi:hypothetical protein
LIIKNESQNIRHVLFAAKGAAAATKARPRCKGALK